MDSLDRTMSNMVAFVQKAAGAVRRHVLDKLRDLRPSVLDFGADPTGVKDSTAAFAAARAATSGAYDIPSGAYKTDAATMSDKFRAGAAVELRTGSTYSVSDAFYGRWCWYSTAGNLHIRDALTGTIPMSFGPDALGFFGYNPVPKPAVTGETADQALIALAVALAGMGLITNNLTYVAPAK